MPLRMRKSIRLGGGVRLNLGKRGVGLSAGGKGFRYSVNSSGRRTTSVGLPGSGLGWSRSSSGGGRARRRAAPPPRVVAEPRPPKPGLLAPAHEKEFFKGLKDFAAGDYATALAHFRAASARDSKDRATSDELMSGMLLV